MACGLFFRVLIVDAPTIKISNDDIGNTLDPHTTDDCDQKHRDIQRVIRNGNRKNDAEHGQDHWRNDQKPDAEEIDEGED